MLSNITNDVVNIVYKYVHEHNIHQCHKQYECTIGAVCNCVSVCRCYTMMCVKTYDIDVTGVIYVTKMFNYRNDKHTSNGYIFSVHPKYIDTTYRSYTSHGILDKCGPLKIVQHLPKNY